MELIAGWAKTAGRANARLDGVPANFVSHLKWWARRKRAFAHPTH
jgi:hypothetical protein